MTWQIEYNGFGNDTATPANSEWSQLSIDDYTVAPVWDEPEYVAIAERHTITGTAMITGADQSAFAARIKDANNRLTSANKTLVVRMSGGTGSDRIIADIDSATEGKEPPTTGYPRGEFSITKIFGEFTAIVAFTITWETIAFPSETTSDAITHTWSQRFSIDNNAATTWTVNGELRIKLAATASGEQKAGPNADAYRALIYPAAPAGFRVETQEYALSSDNTRLVYSVQMKEYGRKLPNPARRGTGSFEFTRDLASSALGVKTFDGTLYGSPKTNRGDLLNALVQVSKNRIIYAGPGADLIQSIRVTEDDIFEANVISYRVVAMGQTAKPLPPDLTRPLVGQLDGLIETTQISPYGDAAIRAVQVGIFTPGNEIVTATVEDLTSAPGETVYQITETTPNSGFVNAIPDGDHAEDYQVEAITNPYKKLTAMVTVEEVPRIKVLSAAKLDAPDVPYQIGRPVVTVTEKIDVARMNAAPRGAFLKAVPGSVIEYERASATTGDIDGNGNRMFTLSVERRYRVLDDGAGDQGFYTQSVTVPGLGVVSYRAWQIPTGQIRMPFDQRTESFSSAAASTPFSQHPKGLSFTYAIDESGAVITTS